MKNVRLEYDVPEKVSLMFAYTSLIYEDVEYYETHKNDPKFIKRVEELKNERNSNNR